MPRPIQIIGLFGLLLAAGCSSSSSGGGTTDGGTSQDTGSADSCAPIESGCGQPCDMGNSLGVGQFCLNITDCNQTSKAHLCSSLNNGAAHEPTYFCTFRCSVPPEGGLAADAGDAGLPFPTDCGQGAECTCDNGGECGCTPTKCLGM